MVCCNSSIEKVKYIDTIESTLDGVNNYYVVSSSGNIGTQDITLTISAKQAESSTKITIADVGGLLGTNQKIIIKTLDNSSYILKYEDDSGVPSTSDTIEITRPYGSVVLQCGIVSGDTNIIQVVSDFNAIANNQLAIQNLNNEINNKIFGSKDYNYSANNEELILDGDFGHANIRLMTFTGCSMLIPSSLVGVEGDNKKVRYSFSDYGGNTSGSNQFIIKWTRSFFPTQNQEVVLQTAFSNYVLLVGGGTVDVVNSGTNLPTNV